ncbi:MAG TPA: hypothetical protein PLP19_02670 [bacterium]|nr:hypothetical protein [bacterium]HPN42369.1 hypothetical protein [bacterium]
MYTRTIKILLLILFVAVLACDDLERNNPLDPKNPSSQRTETVLVESFVNQSGGAYIASSLTAFDRLLREYGEDAFVYLEHHIAETPGTDNNALDASLNRYKVFVPETAGQGIPDVFFNGLQGRVQGASDADAAYLRYNTELEKELGRQCYFTIEAKTTRKGDNLTVSAQIARLGSEEAKDIVIYAAVLSKAPGSKYRRIVKAFVTMDAFEDFNHGEIKSVKRDIDILNGWDVDNLQAVIFVQDSRDLYVYQTVKIDIN